MISSLHDRIIVFEKDIAYLKDISGSHNNALLNFEKLLRDFVLRLSSGSINDPYGYIHNLEAQFSIIEREIDRKLSPIDIVNINRHPYRVSLQDILDNVYEDYDILGSPGESGILQGVIAAKAYLARKIGSKHYMRPVMVIGQNRGHEEDCAARSSMSPEANAKIFRYMKMAEDEGIPLHLYVFTAGALPYEGFIGPAQQIARNIYSMAGLQVPIVSIIGEGGSGGAEALALADMKLMLSHGYYSIISPEGAVAIEKLRHYGLSGENILESCASALRITAADNLAFGYVDKIIAEPPCGARTRHYAFFKKLRNEVILATDEIVRSLRFPSPGGIFSGKTGGATSKPDHSVSWKLSNSEKRRLVESRYKKYISIVDDHPTDNSLSQDGKSAIRKPFQKNREERIKNPSVFPLVASSRASTSSIPLPDRAISCPNSSIYGCPDLWYPDLYGEWCGVCDNCGYHFPVGYQWYIENIFDAGSPREFNGHIKSGNPLNFPNFDKNIASDIIKTGLNSACISFMASIEGVQIITFMLESSFRGGSFGFTEGYKFVRALEIAACEKLPFLVFAHGTAGGRIQEGTHALIQLPACVSAARKFIEGGGLYVALYDNNCFGGPVASFMGCAPYQFAVASSNIGFAGKKVITATTGTEVPPDYHSAENALRREYIQGIWDRRDMRKNLYKFFTRHPLSRKWRK